MLVHCVQCTVLASRTTPMDVLSDQSIRTDEAHGQWVKIVKPLDKNNFVSFCRLDDDTLTHKMETAGEEKRSLVLPSRSFHKAGYQVDTPPKYQQQWITRQRALQRVQVSG